MKQKLANFWTKFKQFSRFIYEEFVKFPTYIMTHPLKGYDMFKREKRANMKVAVSFVVIAVIVQILKFQYEGFLVNNNSIQDLNAIAQITYIVSPIILFVVANWSITTLFDGKGKLKEIFMMICYSLFPFIIAGIIGIILSNILTMEEIAMYFLVNSIGVFLLGYMVFFGLISLHEYGLGKVIVTIIVTVIALSVILFIMLLGFDLFQKIYGFIYTLYREIALRYL